MGEVEFVLSRSIHGQSVGSPDKNLGPPYSIDRYSVFNINVPLAVRFTTVPIGTRKAESSEYRRFDSDLH